MTIRDNDQLAIPMQELRSSVEDSVVLANELSTNGLRRRKRVGVGVKIIVCVVVRLHSADHFLIDTTTDPPIRRA